MTTMPSIARRTDRVPLQSLLYSGDRMDQPTFHALYEQTPHGFKAELIGGMVFVASPVSARHGGPHARLSGWVTNYCADTEGTEAFADTTAILASDSEPQPDISMIVYPELGGQTTVNEKNCLVGPAELALEIANSSVAIDLHKKKLDYEKYGVGEYVVIEVKSKIVHYFQRKSGRFVDLKPDSDGVYKSRVFPGLWLDSTAVFHRHPTKLIATLKRGLATPEHAKFAAKLKSKLAKLGGQL